MSRWAATKGNDQEAQAAISALNGKDVDRIIEVFPQTSNKASRKRRGGALRPMACLDPGVDASPHFRTTNWNIGINLEAQFHVRAVNAKHRDFEQAMNTVGPTDYH